MLEFANVLLGKLASARPSWKRIRAHRGKLTILTLLLIAGCVVWYRAAFSLTAHIGIWAALLLIFAFTVRSGWVSFFGPVFFYDLIRSTRRSNFAALRSFYAGALLVFLFLAYSSIAQTQGSTLWDTLWKPATVPINSLARFGESFFYTFVAVQFIAIFLLTPICAAGAITEEKERRTLEFVLATDLTDRELVVGKLAARMAYLVLFMLTGLPILCLLPFMGGVSPNLVIASFIMTFLSMASLACLSIAISVFANRTRGAVFATYMAAVGYLLISSCCCALPINWLTAGNSIIAVKRLFDSGKGASVEDNLLGVMIEYSSFHAVAAVGCCIWAMANLRVRSEHQPASSPGYGRQTVLAVEPLRREPLLERNKSESMTPAPRRRVVYTQVDVPIKPHPKVGDQPILWKELYAEPFFRLGAGGQTLVTVFGVMTLLMGGYVLLLGLAAAFSGDQLGPFGNWLVRYFGTGLGCLMLLGIGLRAAGTLSSERDRQTMDSLLITLLDNRAILSGKWLGSILGVRKVWLILLPIWALSLFTGGLHPLAFLLLIVAWSIFAAFEAGLGMYFSLSCRSTLVASIATVVTTLLLSGGPWAIWSLYSAVMYQGQRSGGAALVEEFLLYGLTPPVALGVLSFRSEELASGQRLTWSIVLYALCGVAFYGLCAWALWGALLSRFPKVTGRMPVGQMGSAPKGEFKSQT